MNSVIWSSGQRIIKQILDWFQSGNQSDIQERIQDYSQYGVCKNQLNGMDLVVGTNDTLATPSATVRTGVAYDTNGNRIYVSDEVTPYDPGTGGPLHTTDNGLGTPISTPRSTGSLNVPLTPNSDNYVWIDYLGTIDDSIFTLQKISNAKQFYKQTDGYEITATITNTPPSVSSVLLARVNLTGSGRVVNSIDETVRQFSKIKDFRVRITTNRVDRTDVPAVYNTGEIELFLDDHIHAIGNGPVTPQNPHGLTATDIGLTATTIEEHQRDLHSNGIVGDPASLTTSLYPAVTVVTPGLDFITVHKLVFGEEAVVNGFSINSSNLGSDTTVVFNNLDASGIWYIYLDSVSKSIIKTQVDIVSVPDETKFVICKATWTYPTADGGDLTEFFDLRKFGNIASREIQDAAVIPSKVNQTFGETYVFPVVDTTGYKAFLLSQGVTYTSKLGGTIGNSYSVTVINSGLGGLTYTEINGALTINLRGDTPTSAQIVTLIGITLPSAFVDVRETASNPVTVLGIQTFGSGSSGKVKENGNNLLPAGAMLDFGGSSAPSGFLGCDGSAVSRTIYSSLFGAIGTLWGVGDGSTTFNVPDFRRRTAVGSGGSGTGVLANTTGSTGGEETHTLTTAEMPIHNHTITDSGHSHSVSDPGHNHPTNPGGQNYCLSGPANDAGIPYSPSPQFSRNQPNTGNRTTGVSVNSAVTGILIANAGSGGSHNNMQPSAVVTKIIKY